MNKLYICQFSGQGVKISAHNEPMKEMAQLQTLSGFVIDGFWVSEPCKEANDILALINQYLGEKTNANGLFRISYATGLENLLKAMLAVFEGNIQDKTRLEAIRNKEKAKTLFLKKIKESKKQGVTKNQLHECSRFLPTIERKELLRDMVREGLLMVRSVRLNGSQRASTVYFLKP